MSGSKYTLDVYLGEACIGELILTADQQLKFFYHQSWQKQGFAISPHLPLDNSALQDQFSIRAFFQNLFPEGENLEILLETFHLSRNNIFAITQTLGLDLPGALQCVLHTSDLPKDEIFRPIQSDEMVERLKHNNPRDLMIWDGKTKLSIAGVHQKINVVVNQDGELGLGEGRLCSTHILKFQRSSVENLVINEFLMMKLAQTIGLNVAQVELKYFAQYPTLLVKRFDRTWQKKVVWRRHMIDGCQALNLMPDYKYERHLGSGRDVKHIRDGANLPALFAWCDLCKNPAITKKQLLLWVLYNLIIGNWDAHGKNISFFVSKNGIEMAPLYDLISIRTYPDFSQELSMALGNEFESDKINAYQLADFAESCQLPRNIVTKTLLQLCKQVSFALPQWSDLANNINEKKLSKQLMDGITAQIAHLEQQAVLINGVRLDI
ncbi:MAG TPA: HipA domain-containing protein [Gammaproteobacteria bacterium]|nr:HipA domain-containing protein [Gammaproteobacteria bacterium]